MSTPPNLLGEYGPWAASLSGDGPGTFSLQNDRWTGTPLADWREAARERVRDRMAPPDTGETPETTVEASTTRDGLYVEELSWQLPYGPRTEATFVRPADAEEPLPGVLALHDHGGQRFLGRRKVAVGVDPQRHPVVVEHQDGAYSGRAWANELASEGYAVLVPDAFGFGSRRISPDRVGRADDERVDIPDLIAGGLDVAAATREEIEAYNEWATAYEHTIAKSLFCAGTTLAGVTLAEDRRSLDVLAARPAVDESRLGCGGLSGGGLRTVFLGGMDPRVGAAVCAGMMTTWRDYLCNTSHTHTWMAYVPLLPGELDYPEILGLRAPSPTLVLNNEADPLFTPEGMAAADETLAAVFERADAADRYRCSSYPGTHKFDREMQREAFDFFEASLR